MNQGGPVYPIALIPFKLASRMPPCSRKLTPLKIRDNKVTQTAHVCNIYSTSELSELPKAQRARYPSNFIRYTEFQKLLHSRQRVVDFLYLIVVTVDDHGEMENLCAIMRFGDEA